MFFVSVQIYVTDLFCYQWRCSRTVTDTDPGIQSPRWTPWSEESDREHRGCDAKRRGIQAHIGDRRQLTCRMSISCLRSSPSLKMMPMGSLDRVVGSALLNWSHSGFFFDAITLHCSICVQKTAFIFIYSVPLFHAILISMLHQSKILQSYADCLWSLCMILFTLVIKMLKF